MQSKTTLLLYDLMMQLECMIPSKTLLKPTLCYTDILHEVGL